LKELKKRVPKTINKEFVLVFDVSDYDHTDELITWAKKLNSHKKAKEFEKMWESL
jgi:aspartokinase